MTNKDLIKILNQLPLDADVRTLKDGDEDEENNWIYKVELENEDDSNVETTILIKTSE